MSTTPRSQRGPAWLLCCAGLQVSAWAGPTTTPEPVEPEARAATALGRDASLPGGVDPGSAAAVDVPNPSSTIKLLLELQATPETSASASESGRRAAGAGAARSTPRQAPAANPFGDAENPFASARDSARSAAAPASPAAGVDWVAGPAGSSFGGSLGGNAVGARGPDAFMTQRPRGPSADDGAEPRWWMPIAIIRWVREHRQEVLTGAVVALGIAWAVSSYSQRRR
jgi:hypothetical protein